MQPYRFSLGKRMKNILNEKKNENKQVSRRQNDYMVVVLLFFQTYYAPHTKLKLPVSSTNYNSWNFIFPMQMSTNIEMNIKKTHHTYTHLKLTEKKNNTENDLSK